MNPYILTASEVKELELFMAHADRLSRSAAALAKKAVRSKRDKTRRFRGAIRAQVAERDAWTCCYCGADTRRGHVDHVVPWSKGGQTNLENAAWSCASCNLKKSNRVW